MRYIVKAVSLAGLTLLSQLAHSDSITDTFDKGDVLTSAHMNNIKTAINYNDLRIAAMGGGVDVTVDCTTDANALLNTSFVDNSTYTLMGMCNGPVEVYQKRNVVIQGVATNARTDGIVLPAGIAINPYAAIGVYESSVDLNNLRLDASSYVSNNYPWGTTEVAALSAGQQSTARISNVDLVGGDITLQVFRSTFVQTYDNVSISGFTAGGISAYFNSHVDLSENIHVIGAATTTSQYPEGVSAGYNSSVDIQKGGTITVPGGGSGLERYALGAFHNASIRVRDGGVTKLNGTVGAGHASNIQIDGNAVLAGHLDAWDTGIIRFRDSSQSGGYVSAVRLGLVRIYGSSTVNTTGYSFWAGQGSSIGIRNTAKVTSDTPIFINSNSTLYIRNTADLGNAGIACQSRQDQVTISADATNVGSLASCPFD